MFLQTNKSCLQKSKDKYFNSRVRNDDCLKKLEQISQIFIPLFSAVNYLSFLFFSPQTSIIKSKAQISMVTALPPCIVSELARQAARQPHKDSRLELHGERKTFTDTEAKITETVYTEKRCRSA